MAVRIWSEVAWREKVGDELGMLAFGGQEDIALGEAGGLDCGGDVEDVVALGDGEGLGIDVALDEAGVDLGHGDGVVETVLPSLEGAAFLQTEETEAITTADDAASFHLGRYGRGAG